MMSAVSLEKIDILRERLGVSYSQAKAALEKTNGDIIEALVLLEEEEAKAKEVKNEVVSRIKAIISQGNTRKVTIKKDGKAVAEIPATIGALGLLGTLTYTPLAIIGAIGSVSAMLNRYTLEIEKNDGQVEEQPIVKKNAEEEFAENNSSASSQDSY